MAVNERTVLEANIEFHRKQATTYDETHVVRPVTRMHLDRYVDPSDRVLDLGTGTGALVDFLPTDDVVGVDISREMLTSGRGGVEARAAALPFREDTFDAVTARSVLHHLPNLENALGEMRRVLRNGGRLVVANEPVGYARWRYELKRLRSYVGLLLDRTDNDWKAALAEQFDTTPAGVTKLVNIWEQRGISVDLLDEVFAREYYLEYSVDQHLGGERFCYVGTAPR